MNQWINQHKAHAFDETFCVNNRFNAEVVVAAPPAVAMEFDLFRERRRSHWVKGGGVSRRELLEWIEQEVATALAKEREQHTDVLFPIRLDNDGRGYCMTALRACELAL